MHIDKQKDHSKGPQGNTADNAITGVLGKNRGEVFKEIKTKGELRTFTQGNLIIIDCDQSFYEQRNFTNLIPITLLKSLSNDLFIYL